MTLSPMLHALNPIRAVKDLNTVIFKQKKNKSTINREI